MPAKKIAPTLESVLQSTHIKPELDPVLPPNTFIYDPFAEAENLGKRDLEAETSFTQLLDFSFPEEVEEGITQIGEVIYIGDGVCKVAGLTHARIEDIVTVKTSTGTEKAMILGIEDTHIETVVLGDYTKIKQGDQVVANNSKLKVPVGKSLLGRVINPLGQPIDEQGSIKPEAYRDVEFPAPSVMAREPIYEPLKTGVMVVDTTIPVGRGQRELVIGDRKTGKSRLAIDIISNQKGHGIICVYVGVGIQAAKAKATLQLLQERKAMEYTTMVIATSDEPPSLQYMAPYVGTAIAEHYMYQGKNALIVYDDLSKQAKAYRQVSLLLKRSPGRDAYPGDIFFLHSRLLERVSKISKKLGAGSITALPIAETQSGDISDYIITNLMSITDGHIYLDANMMHEGILPAVNSGASVSRIGSKVQTSLMKKIGELTSRTLARYAEVKSFETINTEVAEETLREINRGKRVREMLAQNSEISYSWDEQIIFLYMANSGKLDEMELTELGDFRKNFLIFYRKQVGDEFITLCDKAKDLKEIDAEVDRLFALYKAQPPQATTPAPSQANQNQSTPVQEKSA
ncbi:F0F1 ATP synthase subunit alpha [Candidatus Beckwithbacteria bacterium]|nr:F0F1 ATP synthase subunit alpha [Candidatus Beckwithbacteria bacterium]